MNRTVVALAALFVLGLWIVTGRATAAEPGGASCIHFAGAATEAGVRKAADWMNVQIAAGRTRFIPFADGGICTW